MKKNMMMRIASVLLVAVLLSTCAISGTFAKYTTTVRGSDSVTVAKWDVEVVDKGQTTFAFGLFDTILDSDAATAENDVVATKIAPGTSGKFTITLNAKNEVTTDYEVAFTLTNDKNVPIEFNVNGQGWERTLDSVSDTIALANAASFSEDIIVEWRWAIGDKTGSDNVYGDGATSVTVAVMVTFEQVD